MTEWTIQKLLTWITEYLTKNGVDAPRLSAELLLSHVLGLTRIELYTQFNKVVDKMDLDATAPMAIAFTWAGDPEFSRLDAMGRAIIAGEVPEDVFRNVFQNVFMRVFKDNEI